MYNWRENSEPSTPASLVRCSTTDLPWPINIHGPSRPNYHINLPLQSFCHQIHSVRTYWFNKCLIKDGHSTKCITKERKTFNLVKTNLLTWATCKSSITICKDTFLQVSIMLHFLDKFNPIYPLKHTVKSHWISLNNL